MNIFAILILSILNVSDVFICPKHKDDLFAHDTQENSGV